MTKTIIRAGHLCLALDHGHQCSNPPAPNSKWCTRHEEDQAKILKQYKRISFELEAFEVTELSRETILKCLDSDLLKQWAEAYRKKWILTKRTVECRSKHHRLFYTGGDISHLAHINKLTSQQNFLEEMLFCIDDRAYQLLVTREKAEWLDAPVALGPLCTDDADISTLNLSEPRTTPTPTLEEVEEEEEDAISSSASSASSVREGDDDPVFSETGSSASSDSCTSECCRPAAVAKPPTSRERLLAYLDLPQAFQMPEEAKLAHDSVSNIFRFVISRIPRLLVRALSSNAESVREFLASDDLQAEELDRLWRAMKYRNNEQEGKITVEVVRNAICDAENVDEENRSGAYLLLLGTKVWKTPLPTELSEQGWNLFYRFTGCSGCALSVTRTFAAWARNYQRSTPSNAYSSWSETNETAGETRLRSQGALLAGAFRQGRSGHMEHVKPKKRGLKSVWIERDSRNWCFLRFATTNEVMQKLDAPEAKSQILTWSWPENSKGDSNGTAKTCDTAWISRLRTGNTPAERKAARWTTDASFRFNDSSHKKLLSCSPETCFHGGKNFEDASVDYLIIDTSAGQKFEEFLNRVANVLEGGEVTGACSNATKQTLNDKALYLGRQFFRESA